MGNSHLIDHCRPLYGRLLEKIGCSVGARVAVGVPNTADFIDLVAEVAAGATEWEAEPSFLAIKRTRR